MVDLWPLAGMANGALRLEDKWTTREIGTAKAERRRQIMSMSKIITTACTVALGLAAVVNTSALAAGWHVNGVN